MKLRGGFELGEIHALSFYPTTSTRIILPGAQPLKFRLLHLYEVIASDGGYAVHTRAYTYQFELVDVPRPEIVIYHYDPRPDPDPKADPEKKVLTPHLHVRGLENPLFLGKAHFPTGRVSIEEVLRFAVRELGVIPINDNWRTILDETEKDFKAKKTW